MLGSGRFTQQTTLRQFKHRSSATALISCLRNLASRVTGAQVSMRIRRKNCGAMRRQLRAQDMRRWNDSANWVWI
jgi:hypothetical protein